MKHMAITLLTMLAIAGLMMAGSEAKTITQQFVGCTVGIIIFAGSMWTLTKVLRG